MPSASKVGRGSLGVQTKGRRVGSEERIKIGMGGKETSEGGKGMGHPDWENTLRAQADGFRA